MAVYTVQFIPSDVVMLDPSSSHPAPPDLKCQLADGPHFFELGEIIQQNAAEASARLTRRLIAEGRMPVVRVWDPLEKMLTKKLKKTCARQVFCVNGHTFSNLVSLVD
jgi:hypothetical protein